MHTMYQNLTEKTKIKLQIMEKNICFFLKVDKMHWTSGKKFKLINPLFNNKIVNEYLDFDLHWWINTKKSFARLKHSFSKTNTGYKTIS